MTVNESCHPERSAAESKDLWLRFSSCPQNGNSQLVTDGCAVIRSAERTGTKGQVPATVLFVESNRDYIVDRNDFVVYVR